MCRNITFIVILLAVGLISCVAPAARKAKKEEGVTPKEIEKCQINNIISKNPNMLNQLIKVW